MFSDGSKHFEYDGQGSLTDNSFTDYRGVVDYHQRYSNYKQRNDGTVIREKGLFDDRAASTVIWGDGDVTKPYDYYGGRGQNVTPPFSLDSKQILDANGNVIAEYGIARDNYRVRFGNDASRAVVGIKINGVKAYANLTPDGHIVMKKSDIDPRTVTLLDGTPVFTDYTVENGYYTSVQITPESLGFKTKQSYVDKIITAISDLF